MLFFRLIVSISLFWRQANILVIFWKNLKVKFRLNYFQYFLDFIYLSLI